MDTKKLVIFDFDGTLSDSLPLFIEVAEEFVEEGHIKSFSPKDIIRWQSMLPRDVIAELHIPWYKTPWLLFKARRKIKNSQHKITIFPEMQDCIESVSTHYHTVIISTNSKSFIQKICTEYGVSDQIEIIGGGGLFGKHKKINQTLRKYSIKPENAVLITDEVRDLEAARICHIHSLAVTWGFQTRGILSTLNPDALVDKPEEIMPAIAKILSGGGLS